MNSNICLDTTSDLSFRMNFLSNVHLMCKNILLRKYRKQSEPVIIENYLFLILNFMLWNLPFASWFITPEWDQKKNITNKLTKQSQHMTNDRLRRELPCTSKHYFLPLIKLIYPYFICIVSCFAILIINLSCQLCHWNGQFLSS